MIMFELNFHSFELKTSDGKSIYFPRGDLKKVNSYCIKRIKEYMIDLAYEMVNRRENAFRHTDTMSEQDKFTRVNWVENVRDKIRSTIEYINREDKDGKTRFARQFGYVLETIKQYLYPNQYSPFFKRFNAEFKEIEDLYKRYVINSEIPIVKVSKNPPVKQLDMFEYN